MRIYYRRSWHEKLHDWLATYDERGLPDDGTITLTFCEIKGIIEAERNRIIRDLQGKNWRAVLQRLLAKTKAN